MAKHPSSRCTSCILTRYLEHHGPRSRHAIINEYFQDCLLTYRLFCMWSKLFVSAPCDLPRPSTSCCSLLSFGSQSLQHLCPDGITAGCSEYAV